jgi:hypothetical protein
MLAHQGLERLHRYESYEACLLSASPLPVHSSLPGAWACEGTQSGALTKCLRVWTRQASIEEEAGPLDLSLSLLHESEKQDNNQAHKSLV